jgi:Flp pilus assembly protein TadD
MSTKTETLALALQHHRAGRIQQAEQLYRSILQAGSTDPQVWCYLGTAQLALGQPAQAEASYHQALQLRPQLAEAYADLGIAQAQQGKLGEAAANIQQALQLRPNYPEAYSNLAILLNQLGRPADAVACLEEALRQRPDYPEAYNNLGLVYLSRGRPAEAATYFRRAVAFRPEFEQARRNLEAALQSAGGGPGAPAPPPPPQEAARVYNVRGIGLAKEGRWDEAVASFREAVRRRPDYTDAFNNLGNVLYFQKKLDEAIAAYEEAVRLSPDHAGACSNLGEVLRHRGRLDESLKYCRQAIELRPDFAPAHNHLGLALSANEQFEEAVAHCAEAVRLDPNLAEAHHGLGYALLQLKRVDEAVAAIETALRLKPTLAEAYSNLAAALLRRGKVEEALARLQEALRLQPDLADAYLHRAHALWQLGQFDEAAACGEQVVRLKPDSAEGHNVLGVVHMKAGRPAEAVAAFGRAVAVKPDFAQAHFNRGLALLLQGDYEHGWPEYDWRWRCRDFVTRPVAEGGWDGSPLAGRTILLQAEQGVGDTLQFIRFAPLVKQQGGTVILACSPALGSLLSRCEGIDQVVEQGKIDVKFDVEAPLLSLPGKLKTTLATVPARVPYLFGDPAREEHWRQELSRVPGLKVGIAWQGNPDHPEDRLRSVPLTCFAPLAREGVRLISLQLGPGREQIDSPSGRLPVEELAPRSQESSWTFLDTAAVVKHLDLVITVDTAVAHLTGGLGVPVWIGLAFAPDWRWLLGLENSPWYPTVRLFRQTRFGDWDDVFVRMAVELEKLLSGAASARR